MLPHSSGRKLLTWLGQSHAEDAGSSPRVLLLAAHPDDETIGASVVLTRLSDAVVVFLTDGAPRDPKFRNAFVRESREFYACLRAEEATRALAVAGVSPDRLVFLGGIDQESIFQFPKLLELFLRVVLVTAPDAIVTHPYEGGHPDHDTAALMVQTAMRLMSRDGVARWARMEMTSYHARDGKRFTGEFLAMQETSAEDGITFHLSSEERAMKARMLGCYSSQRHVLSEFPLGPERLRVAPIYDFAKPPHEGCLWYECLGWPITGERWRQCTAETLNQYRQPTCH